MADYNIPPEQKQAMISNKILELQSIVAQREIDQVVFASQQKTDQADAARLEIEEAKAAIDALSEL